MFPGYSRRTVRPVRSYSPVRDPRKFRRPDVTIYDLKVSYTPETAEAVDSLYIDQLGLKIFADEFFSVFSPDSLQLPLHGEASR